MKSLWHKRLPLLQCPYDFTLCLSEEEFHYELELTGIPQKEWGYFMQSDCVVNGLPANAVTKIYEKFNKIIVCLVPSEKADAIQIASMLVHESVHIWRWSCRELGEDHPAVEEEAYAIQGISQALMDLYKLRIEEKV